MKRLVQFVSTLFLIAFFSQNISASEGFSDLIKVLRKNVSYTVLQAYIQHSGFNYNLTADEVVLLNDLGMPATLLDNLLERSAQAATSVSTDDRTDDTLLASTIALAPAPQDANHSFFYGALAPFGTWSQDAQYGWVWQPTAENYDSAWAPYATQGSWVWTNTGWFWNSHYSWGWAPFHYGRWVHTKSWIWVPGNAWASSWVSWRTAPGFFGWAPLPPEAGYQFGDGFLFQGQRAPANADFGLSASAYSFVPAGRFVTFEAGALALPKQQNEDIFRQSRIVDNFVSSGGVVLNKGLPVDTVSKSVRMQLPALSVEWASVKPGEPIPPTHIEGKDKIVTYNVALESSTPYAPQQAIERAQSPELMRARLAVIERAHQQGQKFSQMEDQRLLMLAEQVHFRAEAERRHRGIQPSPTAQRPGASTPPREPRSQQPGRASTPIPPSTAIRPTQEAFRQRMALQSFYDELSRDHAARVQAKANADEQAAWQQYAEWNQMYLRQLDREGGNNQDGTQWQRNTEIKRDVERMVPAPEPDELQPTPVEDPHPEQEWR